MSITKYYDEDIVFYAQTKDYFIIKTTDKYGDTYGIMNKSTQVIEVKESVLGNVVVIAIEMQKQLETAQSSIGADGYIDDSKFSIASKDTERVLN